MKNITFTIFQNVNDLPENWDQVSHYNHFLQTPYLQVLQESAPVNMECFFIGIFEKETLIGTALAQYLDLNKLESFGERDHCLKTSIRNFVFKNFASHVLFLGNNMITGQNGYTFNKTIGFQEISRLMVECAEALITYFKEKGIKIHLVSFKDFYNDCSSELKKHDFRSIYEFSAQPNMVLMIHPNWKSMNDYTSALIKKYRDQYKRARKKFEGITIKELSLEDVLAEEDRLYELYHYVALNAPFNTFFLAENHFSTFKKQCGNRFRICGYYKDGVLIGFHSLLLNDETLETYFLGYDEKIQKEKLLYLNMLYNMTEFGIENGFKKIIFGRTALEIKSSIGAQAIKMSGFIFHTNSLINRFIEPLFTRLEPDVSWQERHPFK
ncbi:8-amino-7-oxononanoate synthase [Flavobacterium sediminis]|uniref:8-amino-7-oxononanoate synthase n=1 Tax=Flavobacterium sediminis TaxID=2201181 RepID=A0A2U8QYT2_9FLAO|nr:GNAT family N-acetyltransferase [Flavobacterium sediminis]AWM15323.1 8-amino-7-oxononanoate synthase [Flavobacterium sediminis]